MAVQAACMVAVVAAGFRVRLAERMGGLQGCKQRQQMRGLVSVGGGLFMQFEPR